MECDGSPCRVNTTMHMVPTAAELTATQQLPSPPSGYRFSRVGRHRQDRRIKFKLWKDNYVSAAASQRMRVSQGKLARLAVYCDSTQSGADNHWHISPETCTLLHYTQWWSLLSVLVLQNNGGLWAQNKIENEVHVTRPVRYLGYQEVSWLCPFWMNSRCHCSPLYSEHTSQNSF
jgi:hypothetical protein